MTMFSKLSRRLLLSALGALPVLAAPTRFAPVQAQRSADWLPSWNEGPAKSSITDFVARVTSGPDFVPEDQRIATFDNDGTLWIEQPMYVQLAFALDRVRELAPKNPRWKNQQPFKAVLEGNMEALANPARKGWPNCGGHPCGHDNCRVREDHFGLDRDCPRPSLQAALHRTGLSTDAGTAGLSARQRLQNLHRVGRRHRVHAPLDRADIRVTPQQVVGSSIKTRFESRRQAGPVPASGNQLHRRQGWQADRHQLAYRPPSDRAFGNSDGDLEMLQWTTMSGGPG